jgi:GntR family transcriptional regulator
MIQLVQYAMSRKRSPRPRLPRTGGSETRPRTSPRLRQSLGLHLDFHSGLPAYLQIVRHVERRLARGILHPGDQLPTVRELAADLGLNFNTSARAYRLLHRVGLVSTQRGRGTYILAKTAAAPSRLRTQTLITLADAFIAEARRQGFSLPRIESALRTRLDHWQIDEQRGRDVSRET